MKKIMKKRQLIMAALTLALAAAVFVNWYYTKPETTPVSGQEGETQVDSADEGEAQLVNADAEDDYFAEAKLRRDTAHDRALGDIKTVMANLSDADAGAVQQANEDLDRLSEAIKLESDIETLVTAKLGGNCVAVINGDAIQVVIPKSLIDDTSVLQITDIILDNTDIKSDNIKIIGAE